MLAFFACDMMTASFFRTWTDEKENHNTHTPRCDIPAVPDAAGYCPAWSCISRQSCRPSATCTLKLESGSFVEDDLRQYFSDVLYSLKTTGGDGYVHVLIEHQSSPDKHMAFRLIRYAVAAMQRHLEAGHKKLPW
jgi:hypothetical protein